jgi:hypothetical protein
MFAGLREFQRNAAIRVVLINCILLELDIPEVRLINKFGVEHALNAVENVLLHTLAVSHRFFFGPASDRSGDLTLGLTLFIAQHRLIGFIIRILRIQRE